MPWEEFIEWMVFYKLSAEPPVRPSAQILEAFDLFTGFKPDDPRGN